MANAPSHLKNLITKGKPEVISKRANITPEKKPEVISKVSGYSATITSLVVALYGFIGIYAFNTPMNLTSAVFVCVASWLLFLAIIISAFNFIKQQVKQQSGIANGFIIVLFLVALLIVTILFGISLFQKAENAELEKAQKTIGISTNDSQISFPYSQKGFVINGEIKDGQFEIMQKPLPLENDTK